MITLRQFEILVEVVRQGSFRRCAEQLGMSQVAVGEHIRALETWLGAPLFERKPGAAAKLTPAGERTYQRATNILGDVADLIDEVSKPRDGSRRKISAAMPPFLMGKLKHVLDDFVGAHPIINLQVDLGRHSVADLLSKVERRELDLAFFFVIQETEAPRSVYIGKEPLAIFVGATHPWATRDSVSIKELAEAPAIHLPIGNPLRQLIDNALDTLGETDRCVGIEAEDFGLLLTSAAHNQGYLCMFATVDETPGVTTGLVRVALDPPLPAAQIRLASRNAAFQDPSLHELINNVMAELRPQTSPIRKTV